MKKETVSKLTHHDDELDNLLKEKLNLIQPTIPRDPEIVRHRRNEYIREVQALHNGKPVFAIAGLLNNKPWQSLFSQRPSFVPFAAAILLIFGLVFGSVGTVYAAQDSQPNDPLYSIKLTGENLRLAFTPDTETKISLLDIYADRRVQEAINLTLQGQPIPEDFTDMVDEYLEEMFLLIASLDEASSQEALKGIQIHLRDQDQEMTNAMNGLPKGIDPELVELQTMLKARQQLALVGLEKPNYFQTQLQYQYDLRLPTSSISDTITTTITISPGHYGSSGPCDEETTDCAPFGLGSDEGDGPFQISKTPSSGNPQKTLQSDAKDNTKKSEGKHGGANKKGK